jgi:predicted RNA-binding Zn ribbon-like protein
MKETVTKASKLKLLGGRLCLDFANTADWHASDLPIEFLTSYSELVHWSKHAGILTEKQGKRLLKEASHCSKDGHDVLKRAIALREVIYRIFSAITQGNIPQEDDLVSFNSELSKAMARSQIIVEDDELDWNWTDCEDAIDQMLWPIVHDAARLLTSKERFRVGKCLDDKCGWLFLDTSRNRSRRWCSMKDCGNRAKARRHYKRSHN